MPGKFLYNLFLVLYSIGIRVSAAWNPKAKRWISGRRNIFAHIRAALAGNSMPGKQAAVKPIWMHCASLGEFEQGRPLLEALKAGNPHQQIILTFFSPSGYEAMKGYEGADHIFYLPMDAPGNAKAFLDLVNPSLVIWVKYEYWFYYLGELKERHIPVILVSGIFRKNQPFFKWYGAIWRKMLETFTHFFVQQPESKTLLNSLGFTGNITINGDTRFDRVIEIADNFIPVPHIDAFCGSHAVLVAGSTWDEDEIELLHFVKTHPQIKFIIAPHEIDEARLTDMKAAFPDSVFYSGLEQENTIHPVVDEASGNLPLLPHVLIIDNVGMLSRLYRYATVTYVGGGFGAAGVHNVLEAAVYGKPVVFGPEYEKFHEAVGLLEAKGALSIDGPVSLENELEQLFTDEAERKRTGEAAKEFVLENVGATKAIMQYIQENRLLTSW